MSMLIKADDLSLGYEGKSVADGISFEISKGDYLCILGENGAGKSTLVKAILGLHAPLSGTISYGPGFSNREIGYLAQQTMVQQSFPASVEEVVLSGMVNRLGRRFYYSRSQKNEAFGNLGKMGVEDLRKKSFQELSGGQMQRVLLARALCAAGKVLLLDEPVSGLDPHTSCGLYSIVDRLNGEGMTIIMVTHDIHPALNSASHVLYLGRGFFFGRKDEYFASETGRRFLKEAGHHD